MQAVTHHIHPTAPLADRALLPGDPGRALMLAQALLVDPRMFNHHRGLWGYTGTAPDGGALTIQSTGMGGPSAAIVIEELVRLGLKRAVRVGTCGGLDAGLELGDVVVVREAIAHDGASRALGARGRVAAHPGLADALAAAAGSGARDGVVVSTDLFYDPDVLRWGAEGVIAVEMEAATLLRLGEIHEMPAGCVLAVSDLLAGGRRERIGEEDLEQAGERVGRIALEALVGLS